MKISKNNNFLSYNFDICGLGKKKIKFSISENDGFIYQSKSLSKKDLNFYYRNLAEYTIGNKVIKNKSKTKIIKNYISKIKNILPNDNKNLSLLQIGSSDGYSLNEFKSLTNDLIGVEPSKKSCDHAKKNFGLNIINKNFEEYNFKDLKYDLIVATHVLEHVFNPIQFLEKCNNLLNRDGLLLIEVPLFDKYKYLPFGYFTLEHLNYFSENVLKNYLIKSLFKIYKTNKSYTGPYPVITIYAKKSHNKKIIKSHIKSDFKKNKKLINLYLKKQSSTIKNIKKNILKKIPKDSKLYFYGSGLHTSILFNFIYDFLIDNYIIIGFFDSSNLKKNNLFYKNKVHLFDKNNIVKDAFIVISSLNSEKEIHKYLNSFGIKNNIIKLHG